MVATRDEFFVVCRPVHWDESSWSELLQESKFLSEILKLLDPLLEPYSFPSELGRVHLKDFALDDMPCGGGQLASYWSHLNSLNWAWEI